jgi:hypothetical protein
MQHLDEIALEALATGREDLLSASSRAHVEACRECRERAELEREAVGDARLALRRAADLDAFDLDSMISRAMTAAPPPASRRSLWIGAAIGGLAACGLAFLSMPALSSIDGIVALGRQVVTLGNAADRVVESLVPGGWTIVAVIGLVLAIMLAVPVRLLLGSWRPKGAGLATGAIALGIGIAITGTAFRASAYRVEGEWPATARPVTLDVDGRPTSEALRLATEAAGIGLVARLPDDPPVTLHVRDVPLADVVQALLGDTNVVVIPSATLVTVRPDAPAQPAAQPPPVPVQHTPRPPEPPPVPRAPEPPAEIGDRMTFGSDILVRDGESVRAVYTMGGDADIRGRAFGDVVTMGGDADVRGEVIGNLTTMGGDIHLRDGAQVHGDLNAMGGEIDVDEGAIVHGQVLSSGDRSPAAAISARSHRNVGHDDDAPGFFRWGLWHALLFLLGLVLLGAARERLDILRSELATRPFRNMFGGGFAFAAGALLAFVFCLTIIGIPGGVVLSVLLFAGAAVGWVTAAWWLGGVLPITALRNRPVVQLAVGLGILFLVGLIPKVGTLIVFVTAAAGFGAVMATKLGKMPRGGKRHVATGPFRTR